MERQEMWYGIGGMALGVIIGILIAMGGAFGDERSQFGTMMDWRVERAGSMQNNIDQHFIEQMIPHHEDAITMAEMAETRATHQELKDLAINIRESQGKEIAQMEEWYRQWFGTDVPDDTAALMGRSMGRGGMHMGAMGDASDLTDLSEAENFDLAFIREMIPHHQMAVMMANMLLVSTDRPEMKQLAQDIIDTQTQEIEDMRSWARAWSAEAK